MRYQTGNTLVEASASIAVATALLLMIADQVLNLHDTFTNQTIVAKAACDASRRLSLYYAQDPASAARPGKQEQYVYAHVRQSFRTKELEFHAQFSDRPMVPHTVAVTCTWNRRKSDGTKITQSNCFFQKINP